MRVGVFDSGIGGLNVLKEVIQRYPMAEYLYYGDTIHLPYGEKTKEELIGYASHIISFFEEQRVDLIIIACGTCSNFQEELQKKTSIRIVDSITPTVSYVKDRYRRVALLATPATVQSKVFEQKLVNEGVTVQAIACSSFVPMLESGRKKDIVVDRYTDLISEDTEAIILGCTHYPLVKNLIQEKIDRAFVDMGKVVSQNISILPADCFSLTIYYSRLDDVLCANTAMILQEIPYEIVSLENSQIPI